MFVAAVAVACGGTPRTERGDVADGELRPPGFRLPVTVRPVRYELELTVDPAKERFGGRVRIAVELDEPTAVVWLHSVELDVTSATVDGAAAAVVPGGPSMIGVRPDRPLAAGRAQLELAYEGGIDRERSRGLYAVEEGGHWYAYTFFEPIDARRVVPCFDEPGFKVPWRVTFHVPEGSVALANEPVERESIEAGVRTVVTGETPPMPSYLLAFVVGPFELVDGGTAGAAGVPVRFIIPRGRAGELRWALEITPRVVDALERFIGLPYPYRKLDVAVVPRGWGTMEHPGIVAMGQPLTLIRPEDETPARRESYANILIHELAHYWFGDYVTNAWWDDIWLNESLAYWADGEITAGLGFPAWRADEDARAQSAEAMEVDELATAPALRKSVTDEPAIQAAFDGSTTYAKGAAVLRMLQYWRGDEAFRAFLRAYLQQLAWRNATASDFVTAMRAELGDDAADVMDSFLHRPGVPLVTARLQCGSAGARLLLAQQRSLPRGSAAAAGGRWTFPVCVRHGAAGEPGARTCALMRGATETVELPGACPTWVVVNDGATGYYRVAYDAASLPAALATPGLSAAERYRLIDDALAAVERGDLGVVDAQQIVARFGSDDSPRVARSAMGAIGLLRSWWLGEDAYAASRRYFDSLYAAEARALGWRRRPGDDDDVQARRRALVPSVATRDAELAAEARRLAEAWLDDRGAIEPDMAYGALWVAAYHGDAALFDRYVAELTEARDRTELAMLYGMLGEFRDPALIERALAFVLDTGNDIRDTKAIVWNVLSQRERRRENWELIAPHLPALFARMRDDEASWMIGWIAGYACSAADRAERVAVLEPVVDGIDGARLSYERGLEQVDLCIEQLARDRAAIEAFLSAY